MNLMGNFEKKNNENFDLREPSNFTLTCGNSARERPFGIQPNKPCYSMYFGHHTVASHITVIK